MEALSSSEMSVCTRPFGATSQKTVIISLHAVSWTDCLIHVPPCLGSLALFLPTVSYSISFWEVGCYNFMKYFSWWTDINMLPCLFLSAVCGLLMYVLAVGGMGVSTIQCTHSFQ
jgi:hypothetical protein